MNKVNLEQAFARFDESWSPRIVGDINEFQIKVVKLTGAFHWHHHETEDELFLVHRGKLRMHFRDRPVDLNEGELIIVPRGVEHMPEALTETCEIVLFEPSTTLNTGTVVNERTIVSPKRLDERTSASGS